MFTVFHLFLTFTKSFVSLRNLVHDIYSSLNTSFNKLKHSVALFFNFSRNLKFPNFQANLTTICVVLLCCYSGNIATNNLFLTALMTLLTPNPSMAVTKTTKSESSSEWIQLKLPILSDYCHVFHTVHTKIVWLFDSHTLYTKLLLRKFVIILVNHKCHQFILSLIHI